MTITHTLPTTTTTHHGASGRRRRRPAEPPARAATARPSARSQRDIALEGANDTRVAKAQEKRDLAQLAPPAACERAAAALEAREPWAMACGTAELLTAIHSLGRNVARQMCVAADVGLGVRFDSFGENTDTAIATIVDALRDRARTGPQIRRRPPSGPSDPAQVMRALQRGNAIRMARAALREELDALGSEAGRERFCEILRTMTEDSPLESMRLFDALGYIPRFGETTITQIRTVTQIKRAFTLGGVARMVPRRREWLIAVITKPGAHDVPVAIVTQADSAAETDNPAPTKAPSPTTVLDAAPLLAWLGELKPCLTPTVQSAVQRARADGTLSWRSIELLCVTLGRPDVPRCLYPDW